MFRTRIIYGYFTCHTTLSYPDDYCIIRYLYGSMMVEHKAGFIDKDIAVNTPDFFN